MLFINIKCCQVFLNILCNIFHTIKRANKEEDWDPALMFWYFRRNIQAVWTEGPGQEFWY